MTGPKKEVKLADTPWLSTSIRSSSRFSVNATRCRPLDTSTDGIPFGPDQELQHFNVVLSKVRPMAWIPRYQFLYNNFCCCKKPKKTNSKKRQGASSLLTPLPSCAYTARKTLMEVLQKGHSHAKRLDLVCESAVNTLQGLESRSHHDFTLDKNSPTSRASWVLRVS